jgi:cytochrome P450
MGHLQPDLPFHAPGFNCVGPSEDAEAYNTHHHHYLTAMHEQYGDIFATNRDGKPVVFVRSPESLRKVLDSDSFGKTWDSDEMSGQTEVDYVMNLIQPFKKNTIFNMHGEENFKRRALLRPLFTGVKTFVPLIAETTTAEIKQWPEGVVDIQDLSHRVLRKNILAVMCGSFADQMHHCLETCHEVMEFFVQRYAPACHDQNVSEDDAVMMERLYQAALQVVVDMRRLAEQTEEPSPSVARSLLYLMMQAGLDNEEMARTFVNVMVAAGEAPASALAQTLEELAFNGSIQERLNVEASDVLSGGIVERYSDLDFAEACMTEGLRVFAPATLVSRSAKVDTELDGVAIPKGMAVGVCVHSVHHDAKQWEQPQVYNPDRKNLDYEARNGFASFSNGQRGCPGKHLAMMICKISLASIVAEFQLSGVPNHPRSKDCEKVRKFVEWSVDGIPLQMQRR